MVIEDYVSFEVAKLLKEKGFDGKCSRIWAKEENESPLRIAMSLFVEGEEVADRETVEKATSYNNKYKFRTSVMGYLCPTLQMVMKWLREEHNLFIEVQYATSLLLQPHTTIYFQIYYMSLDYTTSGKNMLPDDYIREYYTSYEEACEAAIKYCLEKLI